MSSKKPKKAKRPRKERSAVIANTQGKTPQELRVRLVDIYGQPIVSVGLVCLNRCQRCGLEARLPVLIRNEKKEKRTQKNQS